MFENIPLELRTYRQWIVWRYEDCGTNKPTKIPYCAVTGKLADVTDSATWNTFDVCLQVLKSNSWYSGLGFVLSENDPYTFIDLDDPYELTPNGLYKHENPELVMNRQIQIHNEFNSYSELSPSGKGLHIIIKGNVPTGRRRSSIEIYSDMRYMTMTGNIYRNEKINEFNDLANVLWSQMGEGREAKAFYDPKAAQLNTDHQVIEMVLNASNGEKAKRLANGDFTEWYESQSEADFALINIIAFYTQNREQIIRLFRSTVLGQREKAKRNNYVNYMVNRSFDRMLPPIDLDGLKNRLQEAIDLKRKEELKAKEQPEEIKPIAEKPKSKSKNDLYSFPPGLTGLIAQFIYDSAPRPVHEIALAGALGIMSGIVGRAYNISGTGLNQYILILAQTGTGKEAIAGAIDKLMPHVIKTVPNALAFIGPAEISSPQALTKYMNKYTCFVSLVGEFGLKLKQICEPRAPSHEAGLKRTLLDLYNKSGEGKVCRPTIYSDKDKNTTSIVAPAFTLLGESSPERFYECLNESMISEGLLPRFTAIEYYGDRPKLNKNHKYAQPNFELVEKLTNLCAHSIMLNDQNKAIHVKASVGAEKLFDDYDTFCDLQINSSDREVRRHLWNRAHIKSLKLAALVAVGINPMYPEIDEESALWAINIVTADVKNLLKKFDDGEIAVDNEEGKQLQVAIKYLREYVTAEWSKIEKYKSGSQLLHKDKIIPYSYIHKRLSQIGVFRSDRLGSKLAIKKVLDTLVERGDIQLVGKQMLQSTYNTTAICYMIALPKTFDI